MAILGIYIIVGLVSFLIMSCYVINAVEVTEFEESF